jgi:outer membrane biosynthesis protein TonB
MQESSNLMRYWHDAPRRRRDVVTIPTIWLALVLSLAVHLAALWEFLPKLPLLPGEAAEESKIGERLAVRIAPAQQQAPATPSPPPQGAPSAAARPAQPSPPKRAPKTPTPPPAPTPPVVATAPPLPERPAVPAPALPSHRPLRRARQSKAISLRSSPRGGVHAASPNPRRPSVAR